jgi:hypothetical protein
MCVGTYDQMCHIELGQNLSPHLGGQPLPELHHKYQQEANRSAELEKKTLNAVPSATGESKK